MSRVFVAVEAALGRKVVVKVLPPELMAGVNLDRFKREIQVSAQLQHPHIVPVLATGETQGVPYYTMPLVEGETLRSRLIRAGALSVTEAVGVLREVAKALAYAHDHGVVHRDIKPDNILLSGGSAVVADFGIAKAISAARDDVPHETLTQMGTSLGTPAYMSPEQAAADPSTNHRADIYSFGCVAYEVLSGRPPFVAKSPQRLLAAQMAETPKPILELRPDTPAVLAELVMKCLEKDADARPQSAADLARVLETVTSGGTHAALPSILLGGRVSFARALAMYAAAFVFIAVLARASIVAIGLPDWVFPGAMIVMLMGLPVILFTGYVQRVTRRAFTMTPTFTPGGSPSMAHGTMAGLAMKAGPHVSWRRATVGGAYAFGVFVLLVAAFMTLRALGIGPAGSLLASGKLSNRDQVLVADFQVSGADTSLGRVVSEAVRTDLVQSAAISVVPVSSIINALQLMRRPTNARVDLPLAREIAQREGYKAIVTGDVTPLGAGFIVTMRLIAAGAQDELASFRESANSPGDLIPTLDKLTRRLRGKIGESLRSVQGGPELQQVTTGSIEALRKYTEGANALDIGEDYDKAIALLKEAIALDTGFAMAYRKLSVTYANGGYPFEVVRAAARNAFVRRDRMTERERLVAEGWYYSGQQDRAGSVSAYERLLAIDSMDNAALINLSGAYRDRRQFDRQEALLRRSVRGSRPVVVTFTNLEAALLSQGKIAAAESAMVMLHARFPQYDGGDEAWIQYARGQYDSVTAGGERRHARATPARRADAAFGLATMAQLRGKMSLAQLLVAEARRAQSARGLPVDSLADSVDVIGNGPWFGAVDAPVAARHLDAVLSRVPLQSQPLDRRPYFGVATTYALVGRPAQARAVMAQFHAEQKDSVILRGSRSGVDNVMAEIALAEHKPLEAVALFRKAERGDDGFPNGCPSCEYANVGRAFDQANLPDSALAYYTLYLDTPWAYKAYVDRYNLAHILRRVGELREARGERADAYDAYAKFVDLWKGADPALQPQVQDVRRRLVRLKDVEGR